MESSNLLVFRYAAFKMRVLEEALKVLSPNSKFLSQ